MTSDEQLAYVWAFLPGDITPTLCGRLQVAPSAGGAPVSTFVYGRSYLSNKAAEALDPIRLPLRDQAFDAPWKGLAQPDVFGVFDDACPDDWGRYVINRRIGEQRFPVGFLLHSQEDRVGHLCFSKDPSELPALSDPTPRAMLDEAWAVVAGLEAGRPASPTYRRWCRWAMRVG